MKAWMLGLFILIALVLALPVQAQCMILTNLGPAPDHDCDGVIDQLDNCPALPNAQQQDMNRNGVGDSCDLLIEEIFVNPDNHVQQGEIARMTVRLMNNHDFPITDIAVRVRNSELGIDAEQAVQFIPQGEMAVLDFWIRIPKCATVKSYDLSVSASSNGVETQRERIIVERGTVCGTPSGPLDNTVIQVPHELDLDAGAATLLPIDIINLGDAQATYELSVADLGPFATWRIDPAATMSLPAGHSDTAYLYLQTEHGISPGTRMVELTVTSGTQTTTIPMRVYVRQYKEAAMPPGIIIFQIIFILLLLILIIAAIIIAVKHSKKRKPDKEHHKYVHVDDLKNTANEKHKSEKTSRSTKTVAVEKTNGKMETYY